MHPTKYDFMSLCKQMKQNGVLIYFTGPFSSKTMLGFGFSLRKKIADRDTSSKAARAFSIFVELAQNIINYSDDDDILQNDSTVPSVIVISHNSEKYYIQCGNRIKKDQADNLKNKLERLKDMDNKMLKDLYKQQRKGSVDKKNKGGAGLGFIEMAIRASEPVEYKIEEVNDVHAFFSITAVVY